MAEARQAVTISNSASADTVASMIHVIQRAAQNPDVDVDKMERLLAMHERILARSAEEQYNAAFAALQGELPTITKEGNIKDKRGNVVSHYAKFEHIHDAIKPLMDSHGFALSFRIQTGSMGQPQVQLKFMHRGGHHEITPFCEVPKDKTGYKNDAQAVGSSVQYGKRYTMCAFLNINTEGEDVIDEQIGDRAAGNEYDQTAQPTQQRGKPQTREPQATPAQEPGALLTEPQVRVVNRALASAGVPISLVLAEFELGALEELPFEKLNAVLGFIAKNGKE